MPMEWSLHAMFTIMPPYLMLFPLWLVAIVGFARKETWKRASRVAVGVMVVSIFTLDFRWSDGRNDVEGIQVMSFNVLVSNDSIPELANFVKKQEVDLVFLQENSGGPGKELRAALPDWHFFEAKKNMIASRYPIVKSEAIPLCSFPKTRAILTAEIDAHGTRYRAVETHLSAPQMSALRGGWGKVMGDKVGELDQIRQVLASSNLPTIFGGDLNSPPRYGLVRALCESYTNAFDKVGTGLGFTYPAGLPIILIDHLYSRGFNVLSAEVGPHLGSDHRPLLARFRFPD